MSLQRVRSLVLVSSIAVAPAALLAAPAVAHADCDHLTRSIATQISATARPQAPAWARPLITPTQLLRLESSNYHPLTFFLGYSALTLERLGTGGAAPYTATVVIRCRDHHAELVTDPYAWANARAHDLHLSIANAEQAAGYAAEVVSLSTGHRPDAANATRHSGIFRVEVSLAPRAGDPNGAEQQLVLEVGRDASIHQVQS